MFVAALTLVGMLISGAAALWVRSSYSKFSKQRSASGLTGVWAEENTRDAIYRAFRRKETFATSGPRITVRLFGGYGFDDTLLTQTALLEEAYTRGVSMGGELLGADGTAPTFIAWATRDPASAALQRLQIVPRGRGK